MFRALAALLLHPSFGDDTAKIHANRRKEWIAYYTAGTTGIPVVHNGRTITPEMGQERIENMVAFRKAHGDLPRYAIPTPEEVWECARTQQKAA